ncbi:hypothetical protein [Bradyrhizobium yuanmingense]|uniref:hypothetical protein n=1 Tax=Bradyrhizobium yuanmingense TaxID=108015 RepID=UPI00351588CC
MERDAVLRQAMRRAQAERVQREKQQGRGRGIVSTVLNGHRIVGVGNTVFTSTNWRTFQDFLRDYLIDRLDRDWFNAERAKDIVDQHQIARWVTQAVADMPRLTTKIGDIHVGPMTGAYRAFMNLAYNIYLIEHHAEPKTAKTLVASFVDRLKSERADDFVGKLFETYAAAAFLKAGFQLTYENEKDGSSSHVEFVAMFPVTGRKFSVEVKSRNRSPSEEGPTDEVKRLRVGNKLNKALSKNAAHTRVVMIEVNVPDTPADIFSGWPKSALEQIRATEKMPQPDGSTKPPAYVIVTNHAFHNNLDAVEAQAQVLAAGCQMADFGPDAAFNRLKDVLDSQERHKEVFSLIDSMRDHYEIPSTFDGENPVFAFGESNAPTRLRFGETYIVPDVDGREVSARLYNGIVIDTEKVAFCSYQTIDGRHITVRVPLTDDEVDAWRRHPDTFFGEVQPAQDRRVKNWLELAMFYYETYKLTPKERLLEWMKDAVDLDYLHTLPQSDLAIVFCERMALIGAAEAQQ